MDVWVLYVEEVDRHSRTIALQARVESGVPAAEAAAEFDAEASAEVRYLRAQGISDGNGDDGPFGDEDEPFCED